MVIVDKQKIGHGDTRLNGSHQLIFQVVY